MIDADNYHEQAMLHADQAYDARRAGNEGLAKRLFQTAYFLERLAADCYRDRALEPTRSVFYRSAAALALHASRFDDAAEAIALGLDGHPPVEIKAELIEIRQAVKAQNRVWADAMRDFSTTLFTARGKARKGNKLARELGRVALAYGQKKLELLNPSQFLAIWLSFAEEKIKSELPPTEWYDFVVRPSLDVHEEAGGAKVSEQVQCVIDAFDIGLPLEGSLSHFVLKQGKPRAIGNVATMPDAAKYSEILSLEAFRAFLVVPIRFSNEEVSEIVGVLLVVGKLPTELNEASPVFRVANEIVALLEIALTIGARSAGRTTGSRPRQRKGGKSSSE